METEIKKTAKGKTTKKDGRKKTKETREPGSGVTLEGEAEVKAGVEGTKDRAKRRFSDNGWVLAQEKKPVSFHKAGDPMQEHLL